MEKAKNKYRLSLPIPDSVLKQIDEFVEDKRADGRLWRRLVIAC
ncbi:hypothetical protein [Candidatus Arsenophonus triatominarum]|nr:hypothetical protein [Candidatus Arsenophonus triatominarum]